MKFLFLTFFIIFSQADDSCFMKLDAKKGHAQEIQFDAYLNTYVMYGGNTFFKLDRHNDIVFRLEIPSLWLTLVNSKGDVYLIQKWSFTYVDNDNKTQVISLHFLSWLESNTNQVEELLRYQPLNLPGKSDHYYDPFMDKADNIYLNTLDGVVLIRRRQNIPLEIKNLENFHFGKSGEDEEGNVYLVDTERSNNSIAVITKKALNSTHPYGIFLPGITNKVSNFVSWCNITMIVEHPNDKITSLSAISLGSKKRLLSEYNVKYHLVDKSHHERYFVIEASTVGRNTHMKMYFITPHLDVIKINIEIGSFWKSKYPVYAFDKQGTAYFGITVGNMSQVYRIKPNETKFSTIDRLKEAGVFNLQIDRDDNLWIMRDKLSVLEKGKNKSIPISEGLLETSSGSYVRVKKETNEIYVAVHNGLFICSKKVSKCPYE